METNFLISNADENDCSSIADIYNKYLGNGTMDLDPKSSHYFQKWLLNKSPEEGLYVMRIADDIIGWGIIKQYSDRRGYQKTAETSVYMDEGWTGKRYGRHLKEYVMKMAQKNGFKHLVAKIWASNKGSIKYNLDFGYEIVGTQKKIGFVNGEWIDVVIMQYVFE